MDGPGSSDQGEENREWEGESRETPIEVLQWRGGADAGFQGQEFVLDCGDYPEAIVLAEDASGTVLPQFVMPAVVSAVFG